MMVDILGLVREICQLLYEYQKLNLDFLEEFNY